MPYQLPDDAFWRRVIPHESGGRPNVGWGNTDLSNVPLDPTGFPAWPGKPGPAGNSTAAGLYGITGSNWHRLAPTLGVSDFSPESQAKVRDALYKEQGPNAWVPFWNGGGANARKTSVFDPELGREVPYVQVPPARKDDLDQLLSMAAAMPQPALARDDGAMALLQSFIEPPGAAGEGARATEPPEAVQTPAAPPQAPALVGSIPGLPSAQPPSQFIEPPGAGQTPPDLPMTQPPAAAPRQRDPAVSLLESLIAGPIAAGQFFGGAGQGLTLPGGELKERLPGMTTPEQVGAAVGRVPGQMVDALRGAGQMTQAGLTGQPVGAEEMAGAAMFGAGMRGKPPMPKVAGAEAPLARGLAADAAGAVSLPPAIQQGLTDIGNGIEGFFSPSTATPEGARAAGVIREQVGQARRSTAGAEAQLSARGPQANAPAASVTQAMISEPWRPLVNRYVPEFQQYVAAKGVGLPKPALLHFLDFVETRGRGTQYQGPPELRGLADVFKKIYDERAQAIAAEPSTSWAGFIDDYFSHQWADPASAAAAFPEVARQGSGRSLRRREIPTVSEGIDRGLVPVTYDPIEMTMRYVTNMDRYLAHNRIFRLGRDEGFIKFYQRGKQPQGWEPLKGRMAETAVATGGVPEAIGMQAYAPEGYATIYNRAIDSGFLSGKLGGPVYTAMLHAKNAVTQSVLSLSGYHYMAMAQEASASAMAKGIADLKAGDIRQGLKSIGLGAIPGIKAAKDVFRTGRKMERQYRGIDDHGPDFERIADLYASAGGRMVGRGAEYQGTSAANYFTAFRRGASRMEIQAGLDKARASNPVLQMTGIPHALFIAREIGRIQETISAPLFDKVVPRLKAAAFYDEMSQWLGEHPLALREEQLAQAREFSDRMDDRFGEMVMDNVFWGQQTKQALQLAATSLGWELGSLRSLGGAPLDVAAGKGLSPRIRYTMGLAMAIGLENAIYQYIKTGNPLKLQPGTLPGQGLGPDGGFSAGGALTDLVVPRTGGRTPEGAYERALLPGFEKDILGYFHDPGGEFIGKLSPAGRFGVEALTGRDYFGHEIAPFPKYTPEWFKAYAEHVLKGMRPIPFQQDALKRSNIGFGERMLGGNRPAPERWQNPDRQLDMETGRQVRALKGELAGLYAHGARTTEDRKKMNERAKEIMREINELDRNRWKEHHQNAPSKSIYRPTPTGSP